MICFVQTASTVYFRKKNLFAMIFTKLGFWTWVASPGQWNPKVGGAEAKSVGHGRTIQY